MADFPYVWVWRWRTTGMPGEQPGQVPWFGDAVDRTGQRCRVVVRDQAGKDEYGGKRMAGSALIAFEDGSEFVTSRGGIRRAEKDSS